MVWYSHLFQNFPQFIVIHRVKGFGLVNKAEIDVFLELSCFFHDPKDVGNLISGSSAFSKTSLNIRKFTVHMDLIGNFRTFNPNAEDYTYFSSAHGTFSRIDHILGHESNLSKFKKIEIVSTIFSDHNTMRLVISYKKKEKNCKILKNMEIK